MIENYKDMTEEQLKERLKMIREVRNSRPQVAHKERTSKPKTSKKPPIDLNNVPEIVL